MLKSVVTVIITFVNEVQALISPFPTLAKGWKGLSRGILVTYKITLV